MTKLRCRPSFLPLMTALLASGLLLPLHGLADEASRAAAVQEALKPQERTEQDRARDAAEKPDAIASFAGLRLGLRVGDIHAGDGYLTEVLMRSVLPNGKVFANNDPALVTPEQAKAWKQRLENPDTADIAASAMALPHPLPYFAAGLEVIFNVGAYHHAVGRALDRRTLNQSIFDALVPGGLYIVSDARAASGADAATAAAACRTDPATVRADAEAVGFRFLEESAVLAKEADRGTSNACNPHAAASRYLMKFERPFS